MVNVGVVESGVGGVKGGGGVGGGGKSDGNNQLVIIMIQTTFLKLDNRF